MSYNNPFKGKFGPENINIPPGESREIGFGVVWNKDKREVKLFFGDSNDDILVLNEETAKKGNIILTVKGENTDPMYIELIPDFDKEEIIAREIDLHEKKKFAGEDDAKLSFSGMIKEKLKR